MLTLFLVETISQGEVIEIDGDEAHHAIKVLRINLGEKVLISDGSGNWVRAKVEDIAKKSFSARVLERGFQESRTPKLVVVQALPKSDRVKEAIEILIESALIQLFLGNLNEVSPNGRRIHSPSGRALQPQQLSNLADFGFQK